MDAADQAAQESLLAAVAEARRALRGQVFALQASCQHFHGVNPHRRGEFRLARARADVHQQTARSPRREQLEVAEGFDDALGPEFEVPAAHPPAR